MATRTVSESEVRQEAEVRIEIARFFRNGRGDSEFAKNLSAAARAAGITPSYLHRIERANVVASPQCYARLCQLYGLPSVWVFQKIGKLDPSFEERLIDCLATHHELLEEVLLVRPQELGHALALLRELNNEDRSMEGQPASDQPVN